MPGARSGESELHDRRAGDVAALKPERARSATAGIVVEPWRDASFTVDAFRIERRDQIDFIDPAFLLDNESSYPGYVVRKADGTIDHLNLQYTNLGETRVWGIDVSARAKTLIELILGAEFLFSDGPRELDAAAEKLLRAPTSSRSRVHASR